MLRLYMTDLCNKYGVLTSFGRYLSVSKTVFVALKDGFCSCKRWPFILRLAVF